MICSCVNLIFLMSAILVIGVLLLLLIDKAIGGAENGDASVFHCREK